MDAISNLSAENRFKSAENNQNGLKNITNVNQLTHGFKIERKACSDLGDLRNEFSPTGNHIDCKINTDISHYIVKCPLQCSHEVKLMNMNEHLKMCLKTFGFSDIRNQEMENLKKENDELKHKMELIIKDITCLKQNMTFKDEKIEILNTNLLSITRKSLANFHFDNGITNNISNTIVKCPLQSSHEVKLMNINAHLIPCLNTSVKRLDCNEDGDKESENMRIENEEMRQEIKTINEDMMNFREIIRDDRETIRSMKEEIERLKQDLKQKDELINKSLATVNAQITDFQRNSQSIDQTVKDLRKELETLKQDSTKKHERINDIDTKLSSANEKITGLLAGEKCRMDKIEAINVELRNLSKETNCRSEKIKMMDINLLSGNTKMTELKTDMKRIDEKHTEQWKLMQMSGRILLTVDRIREKQRNKETVHSVYFYGKDQPYKMSLWIEPDSIIKDRTCLAIYLCVWKDERNDELEWPFKKKVAINIRIRETKRSEIKTITINKPQNKSHDYSDSFNFFYSDLHDCNLMVNNCLNVECMVEEC